MKALSELDAVMTRRSKCYRRSHLVVRLIASINLAELALSFVSPSYSHAAANSPVGGLLALWSISSSVLLPGYVLFEFFWMRRSNKEAKDLGIDAIFASAWFLAFWAAVIAVYLRTGLFP